MIPFIYFLFGQCFDSFYHFCNLMRSPFLGVKIKEWHVVLEWVLVRNEILLSERERIMFNNGWITNVICYNGQKKRCILGIYAQVFIKIV